MVIYCRVIQWLRISTVRHATHQKTWTLKDIPSSGQPCCNGDTNSCHTPPKATHVYGKVPLDVIPQDTGLLIFSHRCCCPLSSSGVKTDTYSLRNLEQHWSFQFRPDAHGIQHTVIEQWMKTTSLTYFASLLMTSVLPAEYRLLWFTTPC